MALSKAATAAILLVSVGLVSACGPRAEIRSESIERRWVDLDTYYAGRWPAQREADSRSDPLDVYEITISSDIDLLEAAGGGEHPWVFIEMARCSVIDDQRYNKRPYHAHLHEQSASGLGGFNYLIYLDVDWYREEFHRMGVGDHLCARVNNPRMLNDGVHSNTIEFNERDFIRH